MNSGHKKSCFLITNLQKNSFPIEYVYSTYIKGATDLARLRHFKNSMKFFFLNKPFHGKLRIIGHKKA